MTLVRIARWMEDLTLDFAPGVRLWRPAQRLRGSQLGQSTYSFLNMIGDCIEWYLLLSEGVKLVLEGTLFPRTLKGLQVRGVE